MMFAVLSTFFALMRLASAGDQDFTRCTFDESMDVANMTASMASLSGTSEDGPFPTDMITIPMHFHIIANGPTNDQGYVSAFALLKQYLEMQMHYQAHNISFEWKTFEYHINPKWTTLKFENYRDEVEMKKQLRIGSLQDLNIYVVPIIEEKTLGVIRPPRSGYTPEVNLNRDGVLVRTVTIPGGPNPFYSSGLTLIHEIGHWLGLFHPFSAVGNCAEDADGIDDTPISGMANFNCLPMDSCPDQPGMDPINNFMNYGYDECLKEFTPLQAQQMRKTWFTYRLGH